MALGLALCAVLSVPVAAGAKTSLVSVTVTDRADVDRLVALGLDATFQEGRRVEVMLHSRRDAQALESTGLSVEVIHDDLAAVDARHRKREAALQERLDAGDASVASELPTGRVEYRTLEETNAEMRELAELYPDRVKLIELSEKSLLGRTIYGLEVSHDVHEDSGKPVYVVSGVHHAREWPTVEFTMELVWDLLLNDGVDARITSMLERGKLIAVPMMNPDGYDVSRRNVNSNQQKRKNCRFTPGVIPTQEQCDAANSVSNGVDNNRNYPAFWGGPGSSSNLTASNHRGAAPLSEPENRAMLELWRRNQVTVAVNNHTPDRRLLRAPSSSNEPIPADVEVYDELAQLLGADVDWPAGAWTDIYYEASGTAEQTAYYGAGTLAFTPEAAPGYSGNNTFHPPYQAVIDNYTGTGQYPGQSMRAMFLTAFDAAIDAEKHSVIRGTAVPGATLTATKDFTLDSSLIGGTAIATPMHYETTMTVPESGEFEWHMNPSLRPSQYESLHLNEAWTITCTAPDGTVLDTNRVTVARGQEARISLCEQVDVGGTVPGTLSLTVGAPASFGAFTPGVAREYAASTTANVVSTAGDAVLSVTDPSGTGRLVNGAFSLAEPVRAQATSEAGAGGEPVAVGAGPAPLLAWAGPVSNDPVTLAFRQSIGANEALRTGRYGMTLTFTLSTANP